MTQILVMNDTGGQIAKNTEIALDGVNEAPSVAEIVSGSLVNMYNGSTTAAPAATPTAIAATASYGDGNYAFLVDETTIKLGVAMETYQVLVLDVQLAGEVTRP